MHHWFQVCHLSQHLKEILYSSGNRKVLVFLLVFFFVFSVWFGLVGCIYLFVFPESIDEMSKESWCKLRQMKEYYVLFYCSGLWGIRGAELKLRSCKMATSL